MDKNNHIIVLCIEYDWIDVYEYKWKKQPLHVSAYSSLINIIILWNQTTAKNNEPEKRHIHITHSIANQHAVQIEFLNCKKKP